MGAERMHALIMKASVGSKRAVKDTVTDAQTDHFIIIIAVLCIFQCLIILLLALQGVPSVSRDQDIG